MKAVTLYGVLFAWMLVAYASAKAVKSSSSEEDASNESKSSEEDASNKSESSEEVVSVFDSGDLGLTDDTGNPLLRRRRSALDLDNPDYVFAKAEVLPNNALPRADRKTKGLVFMRQRKSSQGIHRTTDFKITIEGLTPNSNHGFHIHEYGTIGASCTQSGGHYNPFDELHGSPSNRERHVGDLGNVLSDENGVVNLEISDTKAKLYSLTTIVGRAIVVHEGMDDLGVHEDRGSKTTGNAGGRIACGVIVWSNGEGWRGPQP